MTGKPTFSELFEQPVEYPDMDMKERYNALVGLGPTQQILTKILGILVNAQGIASWAKKHHSSAERTLEMLQRRPPLIVFAGDVGSGKSELAYTIGQAVAEQEGIDVTLYPLSLASRGNGMVGQMTQLVSAAFEYTLQAAKKLKAGSAGAKGAVILLIDEADALAQSRESGQMHHEDKAGVNAFIRGIDSLGNGKYPAAVIMCTNRPNALDPAIKRRAAEIIVFSRPNEDQRRAALEPLLKELGLSEKVIDEIVTLTGPSAEKAYGFTYSDLMQRLVPGLLLDAYPDGPVTDESALAIVRGMHPTSPFNEQ